MGTDGCLHKKRNYFMVFLPLLIHKFLPPPLPPTTIDVNFVYKPFSSLLCVA